MNITLPWHKLLWDDIFHRLEHGRLPHALLFSGQEGMGKWHFAQQLSKKLLCLHAGAKEHACGNCHSCCLFGSQTHPDFNLIEADEKSTLIKVDQIRALTTWATKTPQLQHGQVCVIRGACGMNLAAANALLKTLEEPPGDVIIILLAESLDALPATIRSRCQHSFFSNSDRELMAAWLKPQIEDAINLDLLLRLTQDAPLRALAFLEHDKLQERQKFLTDFKALILKTGDPLAMAATWHKTFDVYCIDFMSTWIDDLIRLQFISDQRHVCNVDYLTTLSGLTQKFSLAILYQMRDKLIEIKRAFASSIALNKQLLLEDFFINMQRIAS